jgi:hypothetical protein
MIWHYVHKGYYRATDAATTMQYVVRTRPKGDGWMAINDSDGQVLATGLSLLHAQATCRLDAKYQLEHGIVS